MRELKRSHHIPDEIRLVLSGVIDSFTPRSKQQHYNNLCPGSSHPPMKSSLDYVTFTRLQKKSLIGDVCALTVRSMKTHTA